jgi:hypothetical protein
MEKHLGFNGILMAYEWDVTERYNQQYDIWVCLKVRYASNKAF